MTIFLAICLLVIGLAFCASLALLVLDSIFDNCLVAAMVCILIALAFIITLIIGVFILRL